MCAKLITFQITLYTERDRFLVTDYKAYYRKDHDVNRVCMIMKYCISILFGYGCMSELSIQHQ